MGMGEGERNGVGKGREGRKGRNDSGRDQILEQIDALGFKRFLETFLFSRYYTIVWPAH